jgi:sulfonate transport system permease protein
MSVLTDEAPSGVTVLRRAAGRAERAPERSRRRRRTLEILLAVGVPVLLVAWWQVAALVGWIDGRLYPAPTTIWHELVRLGADGTLLDATWVSVRRTLLGFVIGSVGGIVVGMLMGMSRWLRVALEPLLSALYTVPKLALLPIFLSAFGLDDRSVVALIVVTVFFFVWISTMAAVMAVPLGYREAAATFRASRWESFRFVLLPASLPEIFVGLRIAAGVSVLMLVGVEFVVGSSGLGFLIQQGRQLLLLGQSYVGIVLVALFGYVFALLVRLAGRAMAPWAPEDNAHTPS